MNLPPRAPPARFDITVVELQLIQGQQNLDLPEGIQCLLDGFSAVFDAPNGLPPRRSCDHKILLIPSAQLVNIRLYRYSPELKNEIEKQIAMLQSGVIKPSTSPSASPIIMARKKDCTWRLCVDYRHLNLLTLKSMYPMPVIDELLDEISGASWFTKLDLRAGYHQIRLAPGEYKTMFHTHNDHFEFSILAFGLTEGPYTFQSVMNTYLSPVLRHYDVVFFDDILIFSKTYVEHIENLR